MSHERKPIEAPDDRNSQADWTWRISSDFLPALLRALSYFGLEVENG